MRKTVVSTFAAAALTAGTLPLLSGCFPVVATGVGAGALMIADRRTSGTYVEDQAIEWKVPDRISEKFGTNTHVNVTSYNRMVLLTGEVPDAATKAEVERLAAGVTNVRAVQNEVVLAGTSSFGNRSNDAYITSKVKARFVDANRFSANHVKVVTEWGTVFLMGLVTRKEAEDATEIARTTSSVYKVVRVFEYIGEDQAKQLDTRPPEPTQPAARKP